MTTPDIPSQRAPLGPRDGFPRLPHHDSTEPPIGPPGGTERVLPLEWLDGWARIYWSGA